MKYKAKDIADILGVSPATVSLAINNRPGVSLEKKTEILDKIKSMNCDYLLKSDKVINENIGFVIDKCKGPFIDEFPFFNYMLEGINKKLQHYNLKLHMIYLESTMTTEEKKEVLLKSECSGFLVCAVEIYEKDLETYIDIPQPCVFIDNQFPTINVDSAAVNNKLGIRQVVDYLYNMGHRRIGYIKSKANCLNFDERFEAFKEELKNKKLEFIENGVIDVAYTEKEATKDVISYFNNNKGKKLPTAFFADNDLLGCYAIRAIKSLGYNVPDDFSIIGFDNRNICTFCVPMVTTISVPTNDMGDLAVELLYKRLNGFKSCCFKELVGTALIERDSVKRINV